jgi:hypothetical protein
MPTDLEQLQTIRSQALAAMAEITASPKPSYTIDGQTVSWNAYLLRLRQTADWCEHKLAAQQPVELRSQATT